MHRFTVLYPNKSGAKFDFEYYMGKHIPWVSALVGQEIEVRKGISSLGGSPAAFLCVASIPVKSIVEFKAILAQHGAQITADIANFTNIQPTIQFEEVLTS